MRNVRRRHCDGMAAKHAYTNATQQQRTLVGKFYKKISQENVLALRIAGMVTVWRDMCTIRKSKNKNRGTFFDGDGVYRFGLMTCARRCDAAGFCVLASISLCMRSVCMRVAIVSGGQNTSKKTKLRFCLTCWDCRPRSESN